MKNSSKFLIVAAALLLSFQTAFAEDGSESYVISCALNKSNSLTATFVSKDGQIEQILLQTQDFLGRDVQQIVTLEQPRMQLIHYGRNLLVSQNFGRSGYVFLRFEKTGEGKYSGLIDIQFFPARRLLDEGMMILDCHESR